MIKQFMRRREAKLLLATKHNGDEYIVSFYVIPEINASCNYSRLKH